jgi:acetyl-CoA carboxylase biotin carboxyl carrier protein
MAETERRHGLVGTIPNLLRRMHDAGVTSLDVRVGGTRLAVKTSPGSHTIVAEHPGSESADVDADDALHAVVSPLSGVAYFSAGPEQPAYIDVGDVVRAGQVVALVEAMKVFNEIHADRGGRVVRLGVAPGEVVSTGTPLLYLEVDDRPAGDDG